MISHRLIPSAVLATTLFLSGTMSFASSQVRALDSKLTQALIAVSKGQATKANSLLNIEEFKKAAKNNSGLDLDLAILTKARALYQLGRLDEAVNIYSLIDQASDRWTLAVEERAHAKAKAGQYNKALGDLTTLMSPVFVKTLGPEAYFIQALTYYRLCQYGKVIETLEKYKANMRERAQSLTAVANREADAQIMQALELLQAKGFRGISYAKLAPQLPLNFHLDKNVQSLAKANPARAVARVATLAKADLEEISDVTKKLHLVEAELMQTLHIAEKRDDNGRKRLGKFKREKGQMVFPYNGEVWLDEVDNYQVTSEMCPTSKDGVAI